MLIQGVRPRALNRFRYVGKQSPQPTSVSTSMAAGGAITTAPSNGFLLRLQPNQALWIRRYACTVVDGAGGAAHLFVVGGMAQYQRAPFGNANAFIGYPLVAEMSLGASAGALQSPVGWTLSDTGVSFVLVDDWYEQDDTFAPFPTTIQLQTLWKIYNVTAGAINAVVAEELTYDLYDNTLTSP